MHRGFSGSMHQMQRTGPMHRGFCGPIHRTMNTRQPATVKVTIEQAKTTVNEALKTFKVGKVIIPCIADITADLRTLRATANGDCQRELEPLDPHERAFREELVINRG